MVPPFPSGVNGSFITKWTPKKYKSISGDPSLVLRMKRRISTYGIFNKQPQSQLWTLRPTSENAVPVSEAPLWEEIVTLQIHTEDNFQWT